MPTTYIPEAILQDVDLLKQLYAKGQAYNIILYCQEETENEEKKFPHTPSKKEEKEKEEVGQQQPSNACARKFQKPSILEVEEYATSFDNLDFTPRYFYDYNNVRGWCIKGERIKDWQEVFRVWAANSRSRKDNPDSIRSSRAEQRQQSLLMAESRNQEKADRETAEREQRLAEQKAQAVSYEEYLKMKKTKG